MYNWSVSPYNEKVEHGDEVGTQLDSGIEIKDYTEEGNAVVELPEETPTITVENNTTTVDTTENTTEKTFHEVLEDFFGGPISITDDTNSYENGEEFTSSRTR